MTLLRIDSIELENFQGHAHTKVDLSEGVTVLSGESNNGKTAVLRGLSWLLTNRPTGIGFVSHWAKTTNSRGTVVMAPRRRCSVTVRFTDTDGRGHEIVRFRTSTENCYIVDGTTLSAVGADVPPEVSELLHLKEVNCQNQDDGYFFLTLTPGQMASRLNELVHLDTIDTAYGFAHRRKVETNVLLKEGNIEVSEARMALNGLKHIPQMAEDYRTATDCFNDIDSLAEETDGMDGCLTRLTGIARELDEAVPDLGRDLARMEALSEDRAELLLSNKAMETVLRRADDVEGSLGKLPHADDSAVESLSELIAEWNEAVELDCSMGNLIDGYSSVEEEYGLCMSELKDIEGRLPERCPLCGAPIGDCEHDK